MIDARDPRAADQNLAASRITCADAAEEGPLECERQNGGITRWHEGAPAPQG